MTDLHVITLVKWTPDTQQPRTFTAEHRLDRSTGILSELDEHPLEAALVLKETQTGDQDRHVRITAVTMGPAGAETAVKKALQMGADDAVHLSDDELAGTDVVGTSLALRHLIETVLADTPDADHLVLTGMASTDGETAAVPAQLAERLGWSLISQASDLSLPDSALIATRHTEAETQTVQTGLPAVVTVTDRANTPRYPNFKAIMAAKKKPLSTWSLADISVDAAAVQPKVTIAEATPRPPRKTGQKIVDEGQAADELVAFLAEQRLI